MAFISQGISTSKKELLQQLEEAYRIFKYIAKNALGQTSTQYFSNKAIEIKDISASVERMSKEQLLEALENIRHEYYEAADRANNTKLSIRLLKKAVATNVLIQKERRHG